MKACDCGASLATQIEREAEQCALCMAKEFFEDGNEGGVSDPQGRNLLPKGGHYPTRMED